eukprot:TRINITY_DN506_c1_g4_i1.p2 TRINITY_DN506_c1_g4~~TRINITY_DN506_c1_g4_i1.p2  ORF type:complete len:193 (-),score=122.20 TRINITY_DN506_c1_g4_i1:827-1405(-)
MAKSKNHTSHNQSKKAHRNGIKRPRKQYYSSTKGVDAKFLRNQRYAKKNNRPGQKAALKRIAKAALLAKEFEAKKQAKANNKPATETTTTATTPVVATPAVATTPKPTKKVPVHVQSIKKVASAKVTAKLAKVAALRAKRRAAHKATVKKRAEQRQQKAATKTETKAEVKTETKNEVKTETKAEVKTETKTA